MNWRLLRFPSSSIHSGPRIVNGINGTSAGSASEERSTVFIQPNDPRRCASVARSRDYIRDDRTEGSKRCRTQIHPRDYIRRRDKITITPGRSRSRDVAVSRPNCGGGFSADSGRIVGHSENGPNGVLGSLNSVVFGCQPAADY